MLRGAQLVMPAPVSSSKGVREKTFSGSERLYKVVSLKMVSGLHWLEIGE